MTAPTADKGAALAPFLGEPKPKKPWVFTFAHHDQLVRLYGRYAANQLGRSIIAAKTADQKKAEFEKALEWGQA